MGGITDTLHGRWRISSEDRITELSTVAVASKDTPREQRNQDHSGQGAANAPQGLAARGTGRQGFGEFVKCGWVHFPFAPFTGNGSHNLVPGRHQEPGQWFHIDESVQGQRGEFRKRAVGVQR